jgi:hypothetical protein
MPMRIRSASALIGLGTSVALGPQSLTIGALRAMKPCGVADSGVEGAICHRHEVLRAAALTPEPVLATTVLRRQRLDDQIAIVALRAPKPHTLPIYYSAPSLDPPLRTLRDHDDTLHANRHFPMPITGCDKP